MPFQDALNLMRERGFRRLPVVDDKGELVGIIAERDLLYAAPSPATSLSVWELHYLLSKLTVSSIMTDKVIATTPHTFIEEAARLMTKHKIGALPVVDEQNRVIGVITETDIFRTFVDMHRAGHPGLRLTLTVPDRKGVLARLSKAIFDLDGDILSVSTVYDDTADRYTLVMKVQGVERHQLLRAIEALGEQVTDASEI
jgi:acetoin utilization protein AcuB